MHIFCGHAEHMLIITIHLERRFSVKVLYHLIQMHFRRSHNQGLCNTVVNSLGRTAHICDTYTTSQRLRNGTKIKKSRKKD